MTARVPPVRIALAPAVAGLLLALALPVAAEAKVVVLSDGDPLTSFTTAKCRKATTKRASLRFTATARGTRGYVLTVDLFGSGGNQSFQYGGGSQLTVKGPGGSWSNLNAPPDAPPGGGAIHFNRARTKVGIGFSPAFDRSLSSTVSIAGGFTCHYPKKKKRR